MSFDEINKNTGAKDNLDTSLLLTNILKQKSGHFVSLKWKSIFLVSLVLASISLSLSFISYRDQQSQFEQQRNLLRQHYDDSLSGIIDLKIDNLILAGDITSKLSGLSVALNDGLQGQVRSAFEVHLPMFQFDLGVESLAIYQDRDRLLLDWNISDRSDSLTPLIKNWVNKVSLSKDPISTIWCSGKCAMLVVLPILSGSSEYIVVLTQLLSETITLTAKITGVDTGILIPESHREHDTSMEMQLNDWKMHIIALTGRQNNSKVLHELATRIPLQQLINKATYTQLDNRHYEVRVLPVRSSLDSSKGYWVTIDDITNEIHVINSATAKSLFVGATGLLFSILLWAFILKSPMARLTRISHILPLLAEQKHSTARQQLTKETRSPVFGIDELDLLNISALNLTQRLESLEHQVTQSVQYLQQERDFVTGLMQAADVLILTLDENALVTMINPFAEKITGNSLQQLEHKTFYSLLSNMSDLPDLQRQLTSLTEGNLNTVHHESIIQCNGITRHISWVHSALIHSEKNMPATLSIGLDVTEQKQAESRLVWLANYDSLTRLYNRHYFQEKMEYLLAQCQRSGRTGALLYMDIDLFKDINDSSGHQAGDNLLIQVSEILKNNLRDIDIIGRLGGDEFGVILPDTSLDDARLVAEKLGNSVARKPFMVIQKSHRITLSIGITTFPDHGNSVEVLMANSDLAMYQAKSSGRGRYHIFTERDQAKEHLNSRIQWKDRINLALERDDFFQCFQPIMEISSGNISHYEVLLRMRDPDGSIVSPAAFISAAEQTGQIGQIDRMVLNKAFSQLAECIQAGQDVHFAINLSGTAFTDPIMLPYLNNLFKKTGIDPGRVILEITETAAVANLTAAEQMISALRETGCRFSLDDFGVGFTSFTYLKRLPVDFIKIDGAFVRELSEQSDDLFFVKSLAEIAHGLGKKTVAEFVENDESLQILKKFGVNYAQGYHIGKPEIWEQAVRHLNS